MLAPKSRSGMGHLAAAACCTALTMFVYPVQRQRLPSRPARISLSLGLGLQASSSQAERIIPGVQNPHCNPCWSQNAGCTGCSLPSCARPSMVVTERPSAWTANREQDFTALPSRRTVQAPHWLVSQPTCVPVRPRTSRRKWTSSTRGSTERISLVPLTCTVMEFTEPPLPWGPIHYTCVELVITRRGARRSPAGRVLWRVEHRCRARSGASMLRSASPSVGETFGVSLAQRPGTMNKLIVLALFATAGGGAIDKQSSTSQDAEAWAAARSPRISSRYLESRLAAR